MAEVVKTLTINQMSDGSVTVSGPLADTLFCYGLLEQARDAIQAFKEQSQKKVQLAPADALAFQPRN